MTLTLRRSHPKFCLHSATATPAGGVQIKIDKSELWVTKILANPALQSAQSKVMMKANAMVRIPLNRVKTQFHVIPAGVTDWRIVLAENGQKPTRVVVGLINHKAKSGDFTLNPFRFGHNNVTHMEMLIDGIPCQRRFDPDYANGVYARTYASMVHGSGLDLHNTSNGITYDKFKDGMAFYVLDNSSDDNGFNFVGNATVSLSMGFYEGTAELQSAFVYQEKDDMLSIDQEHNVSMIAGVL